MSMSAADDVRPVTSARVLAALHSQGYRVSEIAAGVLAGNWDGNAFTLALVGDGGHVLRVRGTWHGEVDAVLESGLGQMLNDWNRDRIWPKVYTRRSGEGLRVHTQTCFDLADGANDAQLVEMIACGLGTGLQFFEAMGTTLSR